MAGTISVALDALQAPAQVPRRPRRLTGLGRYLALSLLLHTIPALVVLWVPAVFNSQDGEVISFSVKLKQQSATFLLTTATTAAAKPAQTAPVSGAAAVDLDGEIEVKRATYEMLLASRIEKFRFYPKIAQKLGKQGTPVVRLVLDTNGALLEARIEKSSGEQLLDEAAMDIIARAQPFPKPPADYLELLSQRGESALVFLAPIGFELKTVN